MKDTALGNVADDRRMVELREHLNLGLPEVGRQSARLLQLHRSTLAR
jgi:hypothetical protein